MEVCFKIFDYDRDGVLDSVEVSRFVDSLTRLNNQEMTNRHQEAAIPDLSSVITNGTNSVNLENFLVWAIKEDRLKTLLDLLHQVCHVMLGLRPASRIEEGRLVLSWLRREEKRGFRMGDFWYLVSSTWWKQWLDYVLKQVRTNCVPRYLCSTNCSFVNRTNSKEN